jgi:hypothetical protein
MGDKLKPRVYDVVADVGCMNLIGHSRRKNEVQNRPDAKLVVCV